MNDDELSELIRQQATRHTASPRLRADIRAHIAVMAAAEAAGAEAGTQASSTPAKAPQWGSGRVAAWARRLLGLLAWRGWVTGGAGFVMGLLCALVWMQAPSPDAPNVASAGGGVPPLAAELVADHVRSLRGGPLFQVASSDRHTVKPWFQGKLDYAPPVPDLSDQGFELLGARVEQVNGESVAALVYGHKKHIINLFVWPSGVTRRDDVQQVRGFNLAHWSNGSMQCWVVSDMDAGELDRFGRAWRTALSRT